MSVSTAARSTSDAISTAPTQLQNVHASNDMPTAGVATEPVLSAAAVSVSESQSSVSLNAGGSRRDHRDHSLAEETKENCSDDPLKENDQLIYKIGRYRFHHGMLVDRDK